MSGPRFVWTIGNHARRLDALDIIDRIKATRKADRADVERVHAFVGTIAMSSELRGLVERVLELAEAQPSCEKTLSSFVELVAGMDYAGTRHDIGNLRMLREAYRVANCPSILRELRRYAEDCLRRKKFHSLDAWFDLRVRIMDAYALSVGCGTANALIIYYAGSRHTENFSSHMRAHEGARVVPPRHALWDQLRDRDSLTHVEELRWRDKTCLLLGENHERTELAFARSLLGVLRRLCAGGTPCTFMIERHLENARDRLQQTIMCNMPTCALHRTRCDAFFGDEKDRCTGLETVFVDSRHVDCGFLRREIFDAAYVDAEYRRRAARFQKRALRSIRRYVTFVLDE